MTSQRIAVMSSPPLHPPPMTSAQFLALGGIASAAITAVGGLAGAPWAIRLADLLTTSVDELLTWLAAL